MLGDVVLVAGLASTAWAWDSPGPMMPVPEHASAWVEAKVPDPQTAFLWKFASAQDRTAATEALLDAGGLELDGAPEEAPGLLDGMSGGLDDREPRLAGGAAVTAGAGRFGGGLRLDGTGSATAANLDLQAMLIRDLGLTLDLWLRPAASASQSEAECLVSIPDALGREALSIRRAPDGTVALYWGGENQGVHPLKAATDSWTHLCLELTSSGAPAGVRLELVMVWISLRLGVNGHMMAVDRPAWLNGDSDDPVQARERCFAKTIGRRLVVGNAGAGKDGFRGVVDEVRLSRRVRRFYPWDLGWQQRTESAAEAELASPYFKSGRIVTRFRFDGALEPDVFAGRSWSGQADASHFQPGISGQALDLSRIDETKFALQGFHILPDREGTVEFWFRPLDWHNFYVGDYAGADVKYSWLMTLTAKDAPYGTPSKNIEVFHGRAGRDMEIHWQPIHPGTWTHVLISVKDGGPIVYLNGQRQKLWQVGLVVRGHPHSRQPLDSWRERTGGEDVDDSWTLAFVKSPTLVDEFSVFGWAMNEEEAWNAYARWLPAAAARMKPLPVFRVDFDYYAHSWSRQEKLEVRLACLPVAGANPASADCELRNAAGDVLLALEKQALEAGGTTTFTLEQALPFGRYSGLVRSRDADGRVLAEERCEYVRQRPAWLDNTLGEERTVPAPWTPVAVAGQRLGIVGRQIELGDNGLPAAIETLGRPLLARPATLRVAGQELVSQGVKFAESATDRVAWTATLGGTGGVVAEVDAWLEFDGLLYCAVTLKPAVGTEIAVDDLTVEVPLVSAVASQLLANGGGGDFRNSWIAKYVPEGEGSVWNSLEQPYPTFGRAAGVSNFTPHIWVGTDDMGLYFGAENDQGWTVDGPRPAQEIVRQEGAVVVRLNILREPTIIPAAGRRFHFVLLPTPAKPEPPDWRRQMVSGGVNFGSVDTFGGFDMKTDPADPSPGDAFRLEPRSWEHAARQAPQCRAKWGRCILYADAAWPGLGPNFRDWRHDQWAGTGRLAWTPEFEDYAVWAINEFLERGLIDGVYWDDVSVGHTYSLASTAYEYPGSENGRRVGFTALAQRRVNLRLWRLFEAAGKEPCIWAHMTVCYEVPLFSFCRYLSNCEFVTGVDFPGPRDAMDMWSPDTLRLLGGAAKWGTGYHNLSTLPRAMPDTAAARQWAYPQQRSETGLYLASDQWGPADGLGQVMVREKIFEEPVRAYPWWQADGVVAVTVPEGADVRAGVYVADRRALVVVPNWEREAQEVVLELRPDALDGANPRIVWRDLDPGLTPPKAVVASQEEMESLGQESVMVGELGGGKSLTAEALTDLLEGASPAGRAQDALRLRAVGQAAHVLVRPRDYRVLEARVEP